MVVKVTNICITYEYSMLSVGSSILAGVVPEYQLTGSSTPLCLSQYHISTKMRVTLLARPCLRAARVVSELRSFIESRS